MDQLTLLAVLWAAAGTNTLYLHLVRKVPKYSSFQGTWGPAGCLSVARTCPPQPQSGCWVPQTQWSLPLQTSPMPLMRPTLSANGWSSPGSGQR